MLDLFGEQRVGLVDGEELTGLVDVVEEFVGQSERLGRRWLKSGLFEQVSRRLPLREVLRSDGGLVEGHSDDAPAYLEGRVFTDECVESWEGYSELVGQGGFGDPAVEGVVGVVSVYEVVRRSLEVGGVLVGVRVIADNQSLWGSASGVCVEPGHSVCVSDVEKSGCLSLRV